MKLSSLLFLVLYFIIETAIAQTNFKPGYVVLNTTDTIFGEIDYRKDELMSKRCRFRTDKKGNEVLYSPEDITAYRFKDGKYFVSKQVKNKRLFLQFLIKGVISVYYFRDSKGDHYFLEKEGIMTEIPIESKFAYIDNKLHYKKPTQYLGLLNYYMQDAPKLAPRIDELNEPEHGSLIKLTKDYHNEVCKDEACIIFEEKTPLFKIELELVGGKIYFNKAATETNTYNLLSTGILGHIWMPRFHENMFFRTGIIYSFRKDGKEIEPYIKVPLQLEYKYPTGSKFRPIIAYGMNFPFYTGLTTGMNIKLHKIIQIGINYDLEFASIALVPIKFHSQTLSTGLLFKL